jgi:PHB accumulation regulatory domain
MQWMVPKYLEYSIQSFSENQERMREYFGKAFGGMFPFGTLEEMSKQNMSMIEQAMKMFAPFSGTPFGQNMPNGMNSINPLAGMMGPGMMGASMMGGQNKAAESDDPDAPEEDQPAPKATKANTEKTSSDKKTSDKIIGEKIIGDKMPFTRASTSAATMNPPPSLGDVQEKLSALQKQLAEIGKKS